MGTRVELAHLRASAVGTEVTVRADLVHVDGRLLRFDVVAEDADGARARRTARSPGSWSTASGSSPGSDAALREVEQRR